MDVSSLAGAIVSCQMGRLQFAAAEKMMKMNADTGMMKMNHAPPQNPGRL